MSDLALFQHMQEEAPGCGQSCPDEVGNERGVICGAHVDDVHCGYDGGANEFYTWS